VSELKNKRKVVRTLVLYATPIPAFSRAAKAILSAARGVANAAPVSKKEEIADEPGESSLWNSMTPVERFHHACVTGEWTEQDLFRQMAAFRAAKFVQLFVSFMMIPSIVMLVLYAPWWVVAFGVPALASFSVVMLAQSLRHAWWQCQIDLRAMISFKEFVGRSDLLGRLFA